MKIRASYGITGNNNIGDYASIGIMENANYVLGTGTGNIVNGAAQKSFSNADLTWERHARLISVSKSPFWTAVCLCLWTYTTVRLPTC